MYVYNISIRIIGRHAYMDLGLHVCKHAHVYIYSMQEGIMNANTFTYMTVNICISKGMCKHVYVWSSHFDNFN